MCLSTIKIYHVKVQVELTWETQDIWHHVIFSDFSACAVIYSPAIKWATINAYLVLEIHVQIWIPLLVLPVGRFSLCPKYKRNSYRWTRNTDMG